MSMSTACTYLTFRVTASEMIHVTSSIYSENSNGPCSLTSSPALVHVVTTCNVSKLKNARVSSHVPPCRHDDGSDGVKDDSTTCTQNSINSKALRDKSFDPQHQHEQTSRYYKKDSKYTNSYELRHSLRENLNA